MGLPSGVVGIRRNMILKETKQGRTKSAEVDSAVDDGRMMVDAASQRGKNSAWRDNGNKDTNDKFAHHGHA